MLTASGPFLLQIGVVEPHNYQWPYTLTTLLCPGLQLDNIASRLREQRATVPQRMADTLAQQLAAQRPMLHALQQLSNACSTPGGERKTIAS